VYKNCDRHNLLRVDSTKLVRKSRKTGAFETEMPKIALFSYAYRQSCTGKCAEVMPIEDLVQVVFFKSSVLK
jgi:hypothetical protein